MPTLSRRDFNKIVAQGMLTVSGILGAGMILRFLGYRAHPQTPKTFDLGLADQYPFGSRTLLSQTAALLIHDESGFSALRLVCTHLGCTVAQDGDGLACRCHGSRFGGDGNVTHGPAAKPLTQLRVELNDEKHLILFTD
jgi:Rieske Fe-S protein